VPALRHLLLLSAVLAAVVAPAPAAADPSAVIRDCNLDGKIDGSYTKKDLRYARDHLPTDIAEYSDCYEVISAALANTPGGGNAKNPSSEANAANARSFAAGEQAARLNDQKELDRLAREGNPGRIGVGDERLTPGSNGLFDSASASNELPTPLLLVVIALGLLTLGAGFMALRSRVPALARLSLRGRFPRLRR